MHEGDVATVQEERVIVENVSQDYRFKVTKNLGIFFVQVLFVSFNKFQCVCQGRGNMSTTELVKGHYSWGIHLIILSIL